MKSSEGKRNDNKELEQRTHQEVMAVANAEAQHNIDETKAQEQKDKPKTCGQHFSESLTVSSAMIGSSLLVIIGCVIALGSYFMFGYEEVGAVAQIQFKEVLSSHASILLIMGGAIVILILGILLRNSCGPCDAKLKTCVTGVGHLSCFGRKGSRQQAETEEVDTSQAHF